MQASESDVEFDDDFEEFKDPYDFEFIKNLPPRKGNSPRPSGVCVQFVYPYLSLSLPLSLYVYLSLRARASLLVCVCVWCVCMYLCLSASLHVSLCLHLPQR